MPAVRHFGIVASSYRTTHEVSSLGRIGLSNFMLIRCTVLKIWGFDFLQIWLEMPIHKISVFGGFGLGALNVIVSDIVAICCCFSVLNVLVFQFYRNNN